MPDAARLLSEARRLYDDPRHDLRAAAAAAARGGFPGGAEWMRRALGVLRGTVPRGDAAFHRLGFAKYSLATASAIVVAGAAWFTTPLLLPLAVIAFYVVECRMVFAFPQALDGSRAPLRDSHALVKNSTSTLAATATVMAIAAEMLVGGFCGRGLVRSWCVGCLAVLLWYERARTAGEASA